MKINRTLFIFLMTLTAGFAVASIYLYVNRKVAPTGKPDRTDPMETVFVSGGTFTMGLDGESAYPDEQPSHQVTVSDFHIGKYEVTVAQFAAFVEETGYVVLSKQDSMAYDKNNEPVFPYLGLGTTVLVDGKNTFTREADWRCDQAGELRTKSESDHPVVHVCVSDAQAYCAWLAMKTGKPYRLPTEAEWEYAARGGAKSRNTVYSGSNDIDEVAWYKGNSDTRIHKVGTKQPNELGIYDMSGNVAEWCSDRFFPYTSAAQTDPSFAARELVFRCVVRGGSWYRYDSYCRVTDRFKLFSVNRGGGVGFRVVY